MAQTIIPHLWFDSEAVEAAQFYASVFPNSKVLATTTLPTAPSGESGEVDIVDFLVMGYRCMAVSAGPRFKLNPSISIMVNFDPSQDRDALRRIDRVWDTLSEGGTTLMPLQEYPFSERYGWVQDRYGFSWQLIYTKPEGEERPLIIPSFLFVGDMCGKAEEASEFYISVFRTARRGAIARYPAGSEPDREGTVMFTDFMLHHQWFAAMDSAHQHHFQFNEAVSLVVHCADQKEIDYYFETLSAFPESEQCGWLKDKYGVSWQIVPANMNELLATRPAHTAPVVLQMKKIIIADLERASRA